VGCRGYGDSTHCQLFGVLALVTLPLLYLIVQDVLLDHFVCVGHSLGCSPGGNQLHRAALKEGDDWISVRAAGAPLRGGVLARRGSEGGRRSALKDGQTIYPQHRCERCR
jgi:hypothetical protein